MDGPQAIATPLFYGLLLELLSFIVAYLTKGKPRLAIAILLVGTVLAGTLAFFPIYPRPTTVLSDSFDAGNGSYNTDLWECGHGCSIQNIALSSGLLNLKRNNGGLASLSSRESWQYDDLLTLSGKFQIASGASHSVGWIGISPDIGGCDIGILEEIQSPFIQCNSGTMMNGEREYTTAKLSIEFDTWHQMKLEFNNSHQVIKFYIDDTPLGEYKLAEHANSVNINLGIYSDDNMSSLSQIYMDDVIVKALK